jgi:ABC-type oligopeptide transport system substrate-binding subunit
MPALILVAGCKPRHDEAIKVVVIGDPGSAFAQSQRLPLAAQLVRGATADGLVALDAEGHVIPALADRWIVTDDGLSYIFRLRATAWGLPAGGTAATSVGDIARTALRAAIAERRGTPLGLDLGGIEEIRVTAGRVLEIRLSHPMPWFLQLLAQPELALLRHGRGTGPLSLTRTGDVALLTPVPPEKRGLPAVEGWSKGVRSVALTATDGPGALAAFAGGKVDLVLGGTFADLPRVSRLAFGKGRPRIDPVIGLFGLIVTNDQGVLALPQNREAIARAIDRDALAAALPVTGWLTTTRIVAPGAEGGAGLVDERWQGQTIAERQAAAARTILAWKKSSHATASLRIALPQGLGADALFDRLVHDLAAISIAATRVEANAPADLRLLDAVARYPRPLWFLNQLACAADRGLCSEAADALVERALAEPDPVAATDQVAQAEATLTQANVFLPLGQPVRWSLNSLEAGNFAPNRWALHPLDAVAGVAR